MQKALVKNSLSPSESYEAEVSVHQRPALRIASHSDDKELIVAPHGELTVNIEIFGKLGLTYGSAQIEYGFLGVPRSEVKDRFFTRQLSVQFSVTVNPCVEIAHNDFLPFMVDFNPPSLESYTSSSDCLAETKPKTVSDQGDNSLTLFERFDLKTDGNDHCLVILDIYNAWLDQVSVSLQTYNNKPPGITSPDCWEKPYAVNETIQSHKNGTNYHSFTKAYGRKSIRPYSLSRS